MTGGFARPTPLGAVGGGSGGDDAVGQCLIAELSGEIAGQIIG